MAATLSTWVRETLPEQEPSEQKPEGVRNPSKWVCEGECSRQKLARGEKLGQEDS